MARIEFVVAGIFELARPGIERVGRGFGSLAVEASGVEAGRADERIALGAAIDGGELLSRSLQRPVRLALVCIRRELVSIAGDIARLDDRQRLAVLIHRAERARGEDRRVNPARGADHSAAIEGAREFERLLFRFRGDRDEHDEGHAPGRGDRKSPSDTRTTHTRSERPCVGFTSPRCDFKKKRAMRTIPVIGA